MTLTAIRLKLKTRLSGSPFWRILHFFNNCRKYIDWRWKRRALKNNKPIVQIDPHRLYRIHPSEIKFGVNWHSNGIVEMGTITDGDWDTSSSKCDDYFSARWLRERFVQKLPWSETTYYKAYSVYIRTRQWPSDFECYEPVKDVYTLPGTLDFRCAELDALYESLKERGLLPQQEVGGFAFDPMTKLDNVSISIGRYGDLLHTNGQHRFALSKILRLDTIPVTISMRHKQWITFRNEVALYIAKNGKLYQPLTHIDLRDYDSIHSEMRFTLIKMNLKDTHKGAMLDLGAHWGYFCHKFEELGYDCTAVENDPDTLYFLKKLRRAQNRSFTIVESDLEALELSKHYDVVLALNIFHHLVSSDVGKAQLIRILRSLSADLMFFQPNSAEEQRAGKYKRSLPPQEFVSFVLKHSCFKSSTLIGTEPESVRPIYKLTR